MVKAIVQEIGNRADYIDHNIETLYFGGGTPSLLSQTDLDQIWNAIALHFNTSGLKEVTLEANPDDIDSKYVNMLLQMGINRLSMGVQSFRTSDLAFMNRAHNAMEARAAVQIAQDTGLDNITIDLIYGTPGLSDQDWIQNLQTAIDLNISHISSYALTVEEKTQLAHAIKKGKVAAPLNEQAASQFEFLVSTLQNAGFDHYEIANFAMKDHYALHNTNYWKGVHYLGIGPSAHSFNGHSRQWNVANNALYIKGMQQGKPNFEIETLSQAGQMNEYLLTGLRTMWGLDLVLFEQKFGEVNKQLLIQNAKTIFAQHIIINDNNIVLSEAGKLFADGIAADLFF